MNLVKRVNTLRDIPQNLETVELEKRRYIPKSR